jgi:hypothetical protein
MRGSVQSEVANCIRINFACFNSDFLRQMVAQGLVQGYPTRNNTAIVRGKWPSTIPGRATPPLIQSFSRRRIYSRKRLYPLPLPSLIIPLVPVILELRAPVNIFSGEMASPTPSGMAGGWRPFSISPSNTIKIMFYINHKL